MKKLISFLKYKVLHLSLGQKIFVAVVLLSIICEIIPPVGDFAVVAIGTVLSVIFGLAFMIVGTLLAVVFVKNVFLGVIYLIGDLFT